MCHLFSEKYIMPLSTHAAFGVHSRIQNDFGCWRSYGAASEESAVEMTWHLTKLQLLHALVVITARSIACNSFALFIWMFACIPTAHKRKSNLLEISLASEQKLLDQWKNAVVERSFWCVCTSKPTQLCPNKR